MELLDSYPGLLGRLANGEEEDIIHIEELVSCLLMDGYHIYYFADM
jgi:hypothetical protein